MIYIEGNTEYEVDGSRGRFIMTKCRRDGYTDEILTEEKFNSPWFTVEDISESLRHLQFEISPNDELFGPFVQMIWEMQRNERNEEEAKEGNDLK